MITLSLFSLSLINFDVSFLQSGIQVAISMSHLLKLYIYGVYINNIVYSMLSK